MDLQERLGGYEVTAVPHGRTALALVWSVSTDSVEDGDVDVEGGPPPTFGVLALLDDYRITRVPGRAAS